MKDTAMAVVGVPLIDHHWNGVVPRNLTRRGLRRPSLELILAGAYAVGALSLTAIQQSKLEE